MPRSAQSDDAPKRSPRKRATTPRATVERVPRRTAPRKRAPARRTIAATPNETIIQERREERVVERRAPTPVAASKARSRAKQLQIVISAVILIVGVGASAAVGVTDQGQIDVVKTIEDRNERIRTGQVTPEEGSIIVPVQSNNQRQPEGGLRGLGIGSPAPVLPELEATSTATSTDETASSTDEGDDAVPLDSEEEANRTPEEPETEEGATE